MLLELNLVERMKLIRRKKIQNEIWRISLEIALSVALGDNKVQYYKKMTLKLGNT
jgi:hypothetical protein